MPGVTFIPSPPGLGGFGPSLPNNVQNGGGQPPAIHSANSSSVIRSMDTMSVSEIKAKAKEAVQKEGRGASAMSLIKIARVQLQNAKDFEVKGDLKSALASFIKTASLMKMAIDSAEFAQDRGTIRSEWNDLVSVC